jgi:glucose-6-phosphate dehydrogenase assembly protein OpcA
VIIDLPATSSATVARSLVDLRSEHGAVALGRVLTLVVLANGADVDEVVDAATHASHEHPLRVVVVQASDHQAEREAGHEESPHLDAQIRLGGDAGAGEVVVLKSDPVLLEDVSSLITPLLLPDTPVVAWWAGDTPVDAADTSIGRMAHRRLTDAAACEDPLVQIRRRAETYQPGDCDLAWARITLWRAVLAGAMDVVAATGSVDVRDVEVHGSVMSPSADLLAGWLAWALRTPAKIRRVGSHGIAAVHIRLADGAELTLERPDRADLAQLSLPGQPTRPVALSPRSNADCLAEELRRLEPDEVYGETLVHGMPRIIPT